jgi:hypothetical protein
MNSIKQQYQSQNDAIQMKLTGMKTVMEETVSVCWFRIAWRCPALAGYVSVLLFDGMPELK